MSASSVLTAACMTGWDYKPITVTTVNACKLDLCCLANGTARQMHKRVWIVLSTAAAPAERVYCETMASNRGEKCCHPVDGRLQHLTVMTVQLQVQHYNQIGRHKCGMHKCIQQRNMVLLFAESLLHAAAQDVSNRPLLPGQPVNRTNGMGVQEQGAVIALQFTYICNLPCTQMPHFAVSLTQVLVSVQISMSAVSPLGAMCIICGKNTYGLSAATLLH